MGSRSTAVTEGGRGEIDRWSCHVEIKSKRRIEMNTEITIHPKLQHCGLTTGNLDGMLEW